MPKTKNASPGPLVAFGKSPKAHIQWEAAKRFDGTISKECSTFEKGFRQTTSKVVTVEGVDEVILLVNWEKEKQQKDCAKPEVTYANALILVDRVTSKCRRVFVARKDCDGQGLSSISDVYGMLVIDKTEKYLIVQTAGMESRGPDALKYPIQKEVQSVGSHELFGS